MKVESRLSFSGLLVALLIALLCVGPAQADDTESEADRLFNEGQALFEAGDLDAACEKLAASVAIDRAIGAVLNLARCHAAQGKTASAWRGYVEVAQRAKAAEQPVRFEGASALAAELEPQLSKLTIEVVDPVEGLSIEQNGEAVDRGRWNVAEPVDPGKWTIVASAPGHASWSMDVEVQPAGDMVVVRVPALQPDAPPDVAAPEGLTGVQIAGIVVGASGVVALAVGAVFGALTLSDVSDAEEDPTLCPEQRCTPAGRDAIDGARAKGIASTILLGIGALAVGGGITLFVVGGHDDAAEAAFRIGPAGVGVSGRF